jgi:hypothetical protein
MWKACVKTVNKVMKADTHKSTHSCSSEGRMQLNTSGEKAVLKTSPHNYKDYSAARKIRVLVIPHTNTSDGWC